MNEEEHRILTQVGPGTPMGRFMREHWLPIAASSEVVRDEAPLRLMLLGEKLLAFRDSSNRIGLVDHRCPHRCASLFYGRNEDNGLRCVYHGWKFDAFGECVDMPNVHDGGSRAARIRLKSYKTHENNGVIWAYMGSRTEAPPLPIFATEALSAEFILRECNWLQGLEGDIDTSHAGFLHLGSASFEDYPEDNLMRYAIADRAPQFEVTETEYGTISGAWRSIEKNQYWRFSHFLYPFWTVIPSERFIGLIAARAWVPLDDNHTMFVRFFQKRNDSSVLDKSGQTISGNTFDVDYLPNTTDWLGRWRLRQNASNDYMIDRQKQKTSNYSGIDGVHQQDQAITESMGPIVDHSYENLVPSDLMIVRTRRALIRAARHLQSNPDDIPSNVVHPDIYRTAIGGDMLASSELGWSDVYELIKSKAETAA